MDERPNEEIPLDDLIEITPSPSEEGEGREEVHVEVTFPPAPYEVYLIDPPPVEGESDDTVIYPSVQLVDRPFFTTPFSDYSVAEGLGLSVIMILYLIVIVRIIKGGFSWLR